MLRAVKTKRKLARSNSDELKTSAEAIHRWSNSGSADCNLLISSVLIQTKVFRRNSGVEGKLELHLCKFDFF